MRFHSNNLFTVGDDEYWLGNLRDWTLHLYFYLLLLLKLISILTVSIHFCYTVHPLTIENPAGLNALTNVICH